MHVEERPDQLPLDELPLVGLKRDDLAVGVTERALVAKQATLLRDAFMRCAYIAPQQLSHPSSQVRRRSQQNTWRPDAKTSSSSTAAITAMATDDTSALGESEVRFF